MSLRSALALSLAVLVGIAAHAHAQATRGEAYALTGARIVTVLGGRLTRTPPS